MTRAVIRLANDISPLIPRMGRMIPGCGYTLEPAGAGFRHGNYGVVVHPREITIIDANDPAIAEEILDLLRMVEAAETIPSDTGEQQ